MAALRFWRNGGAPECDASVLDVGARAPFRRSLEIQITTRDTASRARHHMTEIEQFALLVGEIYDAALERARWPDVLRQVSGYVNGCAASLMSHDVIEQNASFFYTWNDNPEYTRSYAEKYAKLNPAIVPATIQSKIGDVSTIYDFVPMDEWLQTQIYREWAVPQGYIDCIQVVLDKSAISYAAAAIMRSDAQGPADDEARRRMRLLEPHLRRAVGIGRIVKSREGEASAFADTLDGLGTALFLID
jgi:hypothetical protein